MKLISFVLIGLLNSAFAHSDTFFKSQIRKKHNIEELTSLNWKCKNPPYTEVAQCFSEGIKILKDRGCKYPGETSSESNCKSIKDAQWRCSVSSFNCIRAKKLTDGWNVSDDFSCTDFSKSEKNLFSSDGFCTVKPKGTTTSKAGTGDSATPVIEKSGN